MNKYVFGVFAAVVVLIAAIVLIITRGPGDGGDVPTGDRQVDLVEFADTPATARLTIQGEIFGEDEYEEVRISVNRNTRTIERIAGFTGNVVDRESFSNTDQGFDVFLHALKNAGFSLEQKPTFEEMKGVCPFGNRFHYELIDDGESVVDLWSTSCRRRDGNFAGSARDVRRLFEQQIPEYRDFVREVNL